MQKLKNRLLEIRDLTQKFVVDTTLKNKVSSEVQRRRYSICLGCEYLNNISDTCKKCGCLMQIKTWMPHQSCPIKKWDEIK